MAHGDVSIRDNIESLINELDDGAAILLIHIDAKSDVRLQPAVEGVIRQREKLVNDARRRRAVAACRRLHAEKNASSSLACGSVHYQEVAGNVFLAKTRYDAMWGHASMVWMELNGFWELAELAEWEYVINLSAMDFPLRRSREIYRLLEGSPYRGMNFIEYWLDDGLFFHFFFKEFWPIRLF
jgi:hypothetical protein